MYDFKWKNNGAIKLLIIVGTRPEIIRLAATIKRCREYFDCCVAHTGQNYDKNLNDIFWSDFDLGGPDVWMNVVGENLGQTCGNVIARSYELMVEIKPDALLVLEILTAACQQSLQSGCTFLFSTWKQVTDARMSAFPRRRIDGLWM